MIFIWDNHRPTRRTFASHTREFRAWYTTESPIGCIRVSWKWYLVGCVTELEEVNSWAGQTAASAKCQSDYMTGSVESCQICKDENLRNFRQHFHPARLASTSIPPVSTITHQVFPPSFPRVLQRRFWSRTRLCGDQAMAPCSCTRPSTTPTSVRWCIRGSRRIPSYSRVSTRFDRWAKALVSFTLSFSLTGGLTSKGAFPESRGVRYPTPGTLNPEVTLWLLNVSNPTDVQKYWIKEPISLEGQ